MAAQDFIPNDKVRIRVKSKGEIAAGRFQRGARYAGSGLSNLFGGITSGFVKERKRHLIYGRDIKRPLIGSGIKKVGGGRGRPAGPSGKYVIPGVGPVGVYEYRMWLRQKLRERKAALYQQTHLSPEQRQALISVSQRQREQMQNPENKTIPDTSGNVPAKNIHQEIDDYANMFP